MRFYSGGYILAAIAFMAMASGQAMASPVEEGSVVLLFERFERFEKGFCGL